MYVLDKNMIKVDIEYVNYIIHAYIYIHSNIIIKEFTFGTKKTWPYKTDDLVKKIS